ncbi:MAG: lysophospholipid acyltransferase family protein [bacterium]
MWVKRRHTAAYFVIRSIVRIVSKFKYNFKYEQCKEKGPFLILGNHSIAHDPLLYSALFKKKVYFLTADELLRMGFFSKLVQFFIAPIPKTKSLSDTSSVKTMLRIAKQKQNICIFPEGATTYCGNQSEIDPSIAKLAKKINHPIALVNLEGGFQSYPKFAKKVRKGKMKAYVKRIITPEEMSLMSVDELYAVIKETLKVPLVQDAKYRYKRKAEFLETTIYYCSHCDSFDTTTSHKNTFSCTKCGVSYEVDEQVNLVNENGKTTISELFHKQEEKINTLSIDDINNAGFNDEVTLTEVINYKKVLRAQGTLRLEDGCLVINEFKFELDKIIGCCTTGSDMVDIYYENLTYQFRGDKKFCALKYMNIIYRYGNIANNIDTKFLGK